MGAEPVRAWQIDEFYRLIVEFERADMTFDSDARIIADSLPQPRQAVEYGAFATVGITDHRDAGSRLPANGDLVDGDSGFFGASHRSRLEQP